MTRATWKDGWIALQGEMDHVGCEEVAPSFREAVDHVRGRTVVVDLSAVSFITSRGIGLILEARKKLLARGRAIALAGLRPQVHQALDTVGLLTAVPVCTPAS
jgi:anti-anti-sigma factor